MGDPRLIAFLCDACAYAAADQAGRSRLGYPQSLLSVRVACTGRVEPSAILQAFREGADGVLVAGCHPGSCRHVDGNLRAAARHALLVRVLEALGVSRERCRLEWIGASEAERFAEVVREMTERLRALGPLRLSPDGIARAEQALARPPEPAPAPRRRGARPRLAFYWNASCGGCEESILDLGEDALRLLADADVVLWPAALDAKRADVEALPDGSVDVAFLNGAIRLAEQEEWARLLRRKAGLVVALGACAQTGGIVGLGNLSTPAEILETAYRLAPSLESPDGPLPGDAARLCGREVRLSGLLPRAVPLAAVALVDYVVPGCPPAPAVLAAALRRLLAGDLPPRGAVLAPEGSLCQVCDRSASRPERIEIRAMKDLATTIPDPSTCFLAQGLLCMGPATRGGCEPGCIGANVPCRGCSGPQPGVSDPGAAMLSALASLWRGDEEGLRELAGAIPDPAGTLYRYGLAAAGIPGRAGDRP